MIARRTWRVPSSARAAFCFAQDASTPLHNLAPGPCCHRYVENESFRTARCSFMSPGAITGVVLATERALASRGDGAVSRTCVIAVIVIAAVTPR
jgi:hypothetical protein